MRVIYPYRIFVVSQIRAVVHYTAEVGSTEDSTKGREMPIIIRVLTEADAVAYRALRLRALREDPEAFGSTYAEGAARPLAVTQARLQAPDNTTFGAYESESEGAGSTLVGIVTLVRQDGAKFRHKTEMVGMSVASEARGRGIGRLLVQAVIAYAQATAGVEQIHCTAVTMNAAALSLYRTLGFASYGIERQALKVDDQYWDEELLALRW